MAWRALGGAGDLPRTVRLLSATGALFERMGASMPHFEAAVFERNVAAARSALGEEAFREAWSSGQSLPLDRAIEDALDSPLPALIGHPSPRRRREGPVNMCHGSSWRILALA